MLDERPIDCPCCGARFTALIDTSEGDCSYIQDCEVCCRPLRFTLAIEPGTGALTLAIAREDEA